MFVKKIFLFFCSLMYFFEFLYGIFSNWMQIIWHFIQKVIVEKVSICEISRYEFFWNWKILTYWFCAIHKKNMNLYIWFLFLVLFKLFVYDRDLFYLLSLNISKYCKYLGPFYLSSLCFNIWMNCIHWKNVQFLMNLEKSVIFFLKFEKL